MRGKRVRPNISSGMKPSQRERSSSTACADRATLWTQRTMSSSYVRTCAKIQTEDRALSEVLVSRPETMVRAANHVGMLELTDEVLKRAQKAGVVRKDASARDIPMIMCALAGTYRNPHADTERYIAIVLDGLRTPGARHSKLPPSTRD